MAAYGDIDHIGDGRRSTPDFKPAWSRRYQIASDYVGRAVAFRADARIYQACGGKDANAIAPRSLLDALIETKGSAGLIRHVPRVLYHQHSTFAESKAQRKAGVMRIISGVERARLVSVIMPSKNNARLLEAAARSVLQERDNLELIVVDNGSNEAQHLALVQRLSEDPRVRLVRDPRPFNYSALVNQGVAQSNGEVIVLLNDDVEAMEAGWLTRLVQMAAEPDAGCVGAMLLYPSGRIQHGGIILGVFGIGGHAYRHVRPTDIAGSRLRYSHEIAAVTGACLAVRRKVFSETGGFDEDLPVTLNDVDFCLRVRCRGYNNLMVPDVQLIHHESATRGLDAAPEKAERLARETACFMAKWGPEALLDPYYSPHLTLSREDCSLRDI
jgi:O-antigen biosynthesis protein